MACPAPAQARRQRRRHPRPRPNQAAPAFLLAVLALLFSYALRSHQAPVGAPATAPGPQVDAQVQGALPPGAVILQAIPLPDGSMALAWQQQQAARTGVALTRTGGGFDLWVATTRARSDVAADAQISLLRLPGLTEPVLVSSYATEGCCAWVHLFALSTPPRAIFESNTHFSRLLPSGILVEDRLPGEYPDGPAANTETFTWTGGRRFETSGIRRAPQYYFPLARGMKWTYRSGDTLVDRWVQEARPAGTETEYVVRTVVRRGSTLTEDPEAVYLYDPTDEVRQRTPAARTVLSADPGIGSAWSGARVDTIVPVMRSPAGEFRQVLVVAEGAVRRYYAPNVGLVREERPGEPPLELITYTMP